MYLNGILQKYNPRDLRIYSASILRLKTILVEWASSCFVEILDSGSSAKGTAISLASDVDYFVSLSSNCNDNNGGLKGIYDSLFVKLNANYFPARKQNVSVRIKLNNLVVDVTPGRKQPGNTTNHNLYVSKSGTWTQTNIQTHITDVILSNRTNEIKLLKIWRELNNLEFPSIYLEYLLIDNILFNKPRDTSNLTNNFWHVLNQLSLDIGNPLNSRIVDPANTANIISDLISSTEKNLIINKAKDSIQKPYWQQIVW